MNPIDLTTFGSGVRTALLLENQTVVGSQGSTSVAPAYNPRQRKRKYRVINLTVDGPPEIN